MGSKKKTREIAKNAPHAVTQEDFNYLSQMLDELLKRTKWQNGKNLRLFMTVDQLTRAFKSINILSELIKWRKYEPDE